jgi:hypothetical protein
MVRELPARLAPSASLVVSGMLSDRADAIAAASSLPLRWRADDRGWCALVLGPEPS